MKHNGFDQYGDEDDERRQSYDSFWTNVLGRFAASVAKHDLAKGEASPAKRHSRAGASADWNSVFATIEIAASQERIFRALTTNETERWWGTPDTFGVAKWASDVRVGGDWSLIAVLPNGTLAGSSGEYLQIESPRHVVLTHRYHFDYPQLGRRDTTITYQLDPIESGTRLTVRHDGFDGLGTAAALHAHAWRVVLEQLCAYLRSEAHRSETRRSR